MKVHFDPVADALLISFSDAEIVETEEVKSDVMLDLDKDGRIVAMEFLNVSRNVATPDMKKLAVELA
jgi:uncharacterized protein YuzE